MGDLRARVAVLIAVSVLWLEGCATQRHSIQIDAAKLLASASLDAFTVDVATGMDVLDGASEREVQEQMRDWAVYGTLARRGLAPEAVAKATFRTAPLRLSYLEDMFRFDYGRGRRAVLGDNDVLLFYDEDDPDPVATIARMADRVRMETGVEPEAFQVYRVRSDPGRGSIRVERVQDIPRAAMFGPSFGYEEAIADTTESFEAFLRSIDDVTYAKDQYRGPVLGGRRFPRSRRPNATVEDIAAIYQAHEDAVPGFSLDPKWLMTPLGSTLERLAIDPCALLNEAESIIVDPGRREAEDDRSFIVQAAEQVVELKKSLEHNGKLTEACSSAEKQYGDRLVDLKDAVRRERVVAADDADLVPLFQLEDDLEARDNDPAAAILSAELRLLEAKHRIQCARYDGPLSGTRVGMILFYTDLLAKIWTIDYRRSAPALDVNGFVSGPRLLLEPTYKDEAEQRQRHGRLWFGPNANGYSRAMDWSEMWFSDVATSLYVAGSSRLRPGDEGPPDERTRREIEWWSRHFSDVADFEPQYHIQNQLVKWSLLTVWFRRRSTARFLESVNVRRDFRFDKWYADNRAVLKFQSPLDLRPVSDWPGRAECLDLLTSYSFHPVQESESLMRTIYGGVALGGAETLLRTPAISYEIEPALRHVPPSSTMASGPGTASQARPIWAANPGRVEVRVMPTTRQRHGGADLQIGGVAILPSRTADGRLSLALASERGAIGALLGSASGSNVRLDVVRWPVELARDVTECMAQGELECPTALAARSFTLPDNRTLLVFPESDLGVLLTQHQKDHRGPRGHIYAIGRHRVDAELLSSKGVQAILASHPWSRLTVPSWTRVPGSLRAVRVTLHQEQPPASAVRIQLTGLRRMPGRVIDVSVHKGAVWVRSADQRASGVTLSAGMVNWIVKEARDGNRSVELSDLDQLVATTLDTLLASGDMDVALRSVAARSHGVPSLFQAIQDEATYALIIGDSAGVERLYAFQQRDPARAPPDQLVRQGLVEVGRGLGELGLEHLRPLIEAPEALTGDTIDLVKLVLGHSSHPRLGDLHAGLAGRLGMRSTIDPIESRRLKLVSKGTDVLTVLDLDPVSVGRVMDEKERSYVIENSKDCIIYVEQGHASVIGDLRAVADGLLRESAQNSSWDFLHLEKFPLSSFAPSALLDGDRIYYLLFFGAGAGQDAKRRLRPADKAVVLIRRKSRWGCDSNRDDQISAMEWLSCASRP